MSTEKLSDLGFRKWLKEAVLEDLGNGLGDYFQAQYSPQRSNMHIR